jgi:hypothetical protein
MENENVAPGAPSFGSAPRWPRCLSMIERLTINPMSMPRIADGETHTVAVLPFGFDE